MKQTKTTRLIMLGMILVSCIGCDQATKKIATDHLPGTGVKSYFHDTVRIQYAENPGAFLGMGGNMSESWRAICITGFNAVLLMFVVWVLLRYWDMNSLQFFSLALMLAGGIGNLIDRVFHNGLVTDFLNLGIGPVRTGIFNVADVAISIGVLLFLYLSITEKQPEVPLTPEIS